MRGINLSYITREFSLSQDRDTTETTNLMSATKEYIGGTMDGTLSASGYFEEVDAPRIQDTAQASSTVWLVFPAGHTARGDVGYATSAATSSFEVSTPVDGAAEWSAECQGGWERVISLTAGIEAGPGPGAAVDNGAATTNGGVAVLQLFDVTGGAVTVTVQHSADGVTWVDLVTFDAASAYGAQYATVSGTVNRYLRWNASGTATYFALAVAFGRK